MRPRAIGLIVLRRLLPSPRGMAICGGLLALILGRSASVIAQTNNNQTAAHSSTQTLDLSLPPVDLKSLPHNIFGDQESFWSTPFHMTTKQWQWTVPVGF